MLLEKLSKGSRPCNPLSIGWQGLNWLPKIKPMHLASLHAYHGLLHSLWLCTLMVSVFESAYGQSTEDSSTNQLVQTPNNARTIVSYQPIELASVEQLVLVLSNATEPQADKSHEVLVFLGRSKNRGWEKIGDKQIDELGQHWREVAQRHLQIYRQAGISSQQFAKVELAVEVSIAQFQRLYHQLRSDFLDQPDQKSRLAVLANDSRYEKLRQLGREGIFQEDSLVAKVINHLLSQSQASGEPSSATSDFNLLDK